MMMQAGIVGMGIMGRLLALALHNLGWQVTLFDDQQGDSNCSSAAAGLLTPFSECDKADRVIFQLGQESVTSYWPISDFFNTHVTSLTPRQIVTDKKSYAF
ncbi:FAD-dependent oxidoreductase [Rickettsiella endosymbiont of Miltochrista miniata]|uniref:FAD-dependent oxidoreductase n=1 Tax=Rickettsiella endosymbiont of Miltochrista miniata TaxID=3066239 RepID=UPI00313AF4F2